MTKSVRFLIVFIILLVMIMFSRGNDLRQTVVEKPTPSVAVAASIDEPPLQRNLVLVEFFSGL